MIVSKFGGSIMADVQGVKRAIEIINSDPERRYVIASAPGQTSNYTGITDLLFMCHASFNNREDYNEMLDRISKRYQKTIDSLEINFDLQAEILNLRKDLLLGQSPDYIGSRGEYIMGKILAASLGWDFFDASEIIFFNSDGTLNEDKTFRTAHEKLKKLEHAVIPGFYGSMPDGSIKTFSRGDGDSSGAIVARAVKADLFEKWSDTTKIYSADPAVVPEPKLIRNITYTEAIELNYVGINIIKDSVLFILRDAEIPLKICSVHDTENHGMLISSKLPEHVFRSVAVCIAGRRNFNVIHIEKYGLNKIYGFGEKLFGLFAKYHVACEHCLSGIYKMSIVVKTPMFDLQRNEILNEIKRVIEPDSIMLEKNLSLIAIIGQGMGIEKRMFEKVFVALANAGIKVRMVDQGSDALNIIIGVYDEDYHSAVKALYEAMILKG